MTIHDHIHSTLEKARKFQNDLLKSFPKRKHALLQTVEALASTERPCSVVEISLAAPFQRSYSNIHKAIDAPHSRKKQLPSTPSSKNEAHAIAKQDDKFVALTRLWTDIFSNLLPQEITRPFKLFAIDSTSMSHPYADTLDDRTFVREAGQLGSPITIGLQASILAFIPEKVEGEAKWTLPLSIERVSSKETALQVAQRQLEEVVKRLHNTCLSVVLADCGYAGLVPASENQIVIVRGRNDRVGHRPYIPTNDGSVRRGRPRKYESGTLRFSENIPMGDQGGPDEEIEYESVCNGRPVFVFLSRWRNVHVHGYDELVDVVKCEIFLKEDTSKTVFQSPLLLIISGKRKQELTSRQIYESYLSRFDIEHLIRFLKRNLLLSGHQTPEIQRQVTWWWLCLMAYWLLYLVRELASDASRPWMAKRPANRKASPGEVKRVFGKTIFPKLGSPSQKPVARGKSNGRKKGMTLPKRERKKPVKKKKVSRKSLAA